MGWKTESGHKEELLQFRSVKWNDSNEKMKSQDLYHTAEFIYRGKKSQD